MLHSSLPQIFHWECHIMVGATSTTSDEPVNTPTVYCTLTSMTHWMNQKPFDWLNNYLLTWTFIRLISKTHLKHHISQAQPNYLLDSYTNITKTHTDEHVNKPIHSKDDLKANMLINLFTVKMTWKRKIRTVLSLSTYAYILNTYWSAGKVLLSCHSFSSQNEYKPLCF